MAGYGKFSDFYDRFIGTVNYPKRAEYFDSMIKKYIGQAELLLDLACGTATLSIELAKLGYEVIGVDGSPDMLSYAMQKSCETEFSILYLCQEMTELDLYGTVDVTICALDSINHIVDLASLDKVFHRVSLFTRPDGLFIFDVNTIYKHQNILADNAFVFEDESAVCVWRNSLGNDNIVDIHLDIFEEKGKTYQRYSESFKERAYDNSVLTKLLEKNTFELIEIFNEDSFDKPMSNSERIIFVARRRNGS